MRATHVDEPAIEDCKPDPYEDYNPFNTDDYIGQEEYMGLQSIPGESLLPPHVKAARIVYDYEQQEKCCFYCDETGHFAWDCPKRLKDEKEKGNLNAKGASKQGAQKP